MRTRRIAILIDGGFFIKRLSKLVEPQYRDSPKTVADSARILCKRHVRSLIGEKGEPRKSRWLDHVYRLFYYDATPFDQVAHHPITNVQIDFAKTPEAKFRQELFQELRRQRKFALRLGKVNKEDDWHIKNSALVKKLLRTRGFLNVLEAAAAGQAMPDLDETQRLQLTNIAAAWRGLTPDDVKLGLRQKGVDKSIANNAEIDVIWDQWQEKLEPLREKLNTALKKSWQEWEIPRDVDAKWPDAAKELHADWWQARIARQQEIDKSIAAKADSEFLYDRPYENKKCVRVAGPFTVESISPHRVLTVGADDELIDTWTKIAEDPRNYGTKQQDFSTVILDNLASAGVQQAHKEDRITFSSLVPWPGELICAEGRYQEGETVRRAGIFIGPEFGTVTRPDLAAAAREAGESGFDVLIACAFSYDAHSAEFEKLGRLPVLKARMNADLHMAGELKNTGKGNLFVIFGEPDISILPQPDGQLKVKVNGVDVFHPQTGEVRSDGPEGIACWFIDTDYNEESFFVRHAYFLGQNDPYKSLKTTLKAEIDEEAWSSLNSDISRAFPKPSTGRIAVKVINHLGDEVMKVFGV